MRPLTLYQPKELLPVGSRPALSYLVDELALAGITEILLITSAEKETIETLFHAVPFTTWHRDEPPPAGDSATGPRIWSVRQREQLGLADAVRYAEGFCEHEPFVLALGDCLLVQDHADGAAGQDGRPFTARLIAAHLSTGACCTIGVEPVARARTAAYGIVAPRAEGPPPAGDAPFALRDIVEKPDPAAAPSTLAVAGRYVCEPALFAALRRVPPSARGEYELPDALRDLLAHGHALQALCRRPDERRYDVGSPAGYMAAFLACSMADPAGREALALLPPWVRTALCARAEGGDAAMRAP
jgi:UTP--glucose-1-phosphate uridylyltransferase